MIRVLLDINIVLDLFLQRHPWSADAAALWKAQRKKAFEAQLASSSVPTIYYLVSQETDSEHALSVVDECLATLAIIPVDRGVLVLARELALDDFEDSLQAAAAAQAGVDYIVTRDPHGFARSPIPLISAAELRARLRLRSGKK